MERIDSPSSTALVIAKSQALLGNDPRVGALIPRLSVRWANEFIRAASPLWAQLVRWGDGRAASFGCVRAIECGMIPGMTLHYFLRKRAIAQRVRETLREGRVRQLVVLAAGFDTLGLLMQEEFPDLRVIEVDHPATQALKRHVLTRDGARPSYEFLAADLARADLGEALPSRTSFEARQPTLFVAESLLMYFAESEVRRLLGAVRAQMAEGSQLLFTFMEPGPRGNARFGNQTKLLDLWLIWKGEPFRWALAPDAAEAFVRSCSLRLVGLLTDADLRAEAFREHPQLAGLSVARGEHLIACRADGIELRR